jgi:hypothetical protein
MHFSWYLQPAWIAQVDFHLKCIPSVIAASLAFVADPSL